MTRVADLLEWIDAFAPPRLAEAWDNIGLLWGDPLSPVTRLMTCLTVTPQTAAEAIETGTELIVSHHPVLFRAVKQVRADHRETGTLWRLARAGVSIISPHTAFDNTAGGINDGLARRLGLSGVQPLRPTPTPALTPADAALKVIVFVPRSDREAVLAAAFAAGAGRIGAYEECSFTIPGQGTFFGTEGANPAVGQAGRRETVREQRVEVVCPAGRLAPVLAAIRAHHSYEEPAIDVYPLHPIPRGAGADSGPGAGEGAGRVGRLSEVTTLDELARRVATLLAAPGLQAVGAPDRSVDRVAIVCGAGDDFISDAAKAGADVLLTGEARFHRGLEAESLGLALIVAGHHATERPGVVDLAERLAGSFPELVVWASRREADPLRPVF
jgi:dinuclear metal center YbgI/SA1388 family protein